MDILPFLGHSWADVAHLWYTARGDATLITAKYEGLTPLGLDGMMVLVFQLQPHSLVLEYILE